MLFSGTLMFALKELSHFLKVPGKQCSLLFCDADQLALKDELITFRFQSFGNNN